MTRETCQECPHCADCCQACGKKMPRRFRYGCAECWHVWRTGWHLIWHDLRLWARLEGWRRSLVRVRRAKSIYVCPCCAHDL